MTYPHPPIALVDGPAAGMLVSIGHFRGGEAVVAVRDRPLSPFAYLTDGDGPVPPLPAPRRAVYRLIYRDGEGGTIEATFFAWDDQRPVEHPELVAATCNASDEDILGLMDDLHRARTRRSD
jgi:hypothetical protein